MDAYCQRVIKKHWPEAEVHGDIRKFIADTECGGHIFGQPQEQSDTGLQQTQCDLAESVEQPVILTGGFPCQPFSQAGRRKGTSDDRYLWPEMLRVIQLYKPTWVIAENVRGLVTWNEGLVFEQVCADLEGEGYEVQPLIIPAVAVNAPHRRDRVWFIAHRRSEEQRRVSSSTWEAVSEIRNPSWQRNWPEVATEFCSVDDGLPVELDGFKLSKAQHRASQLKAYGNAIVPQVAMEIFKAILAPTSAN